MQAGNSHHARMRNRGTVSRTPNQIYFDQPLLAAA